MKGERVIEAGHQRLRIEIRGTRNDPPSLFVGMDIPHVILTAKHALAGYFLGMQYLLFSAGLPLDIIFNVLRFFFRLLEEQLMQFTLRNRRRNEAIAEWFGRFAFN